MTIAWIVGTILLVLALIAFLNVGLHFSYTDSLHVYAVIAFFRLDLIKKFGADKPKKNKLRHYDGGSFGSFYDGNGTERKKERKAGHKAGKTVSPASSAASSENTGKGTHPRASLPPEKTKEPKSALSFVRAMLEDVFPPFRRYARLRVRKLHVVAADKSPDRTALLFGELNTACASLLYVCRRYEICRIDEENVAVYSDFSRDKPYCSFSVTLDLFVFQLLIIAVKALRSYLKNKS